jgi:hypothetical protein
VKGIDDDEYGDDDLDPDELELSGRVMLPVKMGNTKLKRNWIPLLRVYGLAMPGIAVTLASLTQTMLVLLELTRARWM